MRPEDGPAVAALVRQTGVLDPNSTYAYVLLGDRFGEHCLVAEDDGRVAGFVSGFLDPRDPSTLFLWQIGVAPTAQGMGLGARLLRAFAARPAHAGATALETTIAIDNAASEALFRAFAREQGAAFTERGRYPSDLLDGHTCEIVFRISPLEGGPRELTEDEDPT